MICASSVTENNGLLYSSALLLVMAVIGMVLGYCSYLLDISLKKDKE